MIDLIRTSLLGQFEAALCMLNDCVTQCPEPQWDELIAKYPFWQVAYHTLCFVDLYLSPDEKSFEPRTEFHPAGWKEFEDEYPSRRFSKSELLDYLTICRQKLVQTLSSETLQTLEGPSGQSHLPFSRCELHLYNIRHVQHHAGQLSAFLRKAGVNTKWVKTGWR